GSPINPYLSKIMAALQPSGPPPVSEFSEVTTLIAMGGRTNIGGVPGAANLEVAVLGPDGTITLINDSIQAVGGAVIDPATGRPIGVLGHGDMQLVFVDRLSGGVFINGVEGLLSIGTLTRNPDGFVQGTGFFLNGAEAQNALRYLG